MKLATLPGPTRDGSLVLVTRDLSRAVPAAPHASTFQEALDRWPSVERDLRDLWQRLEDGRCREAFPFRQEDALAPLPRSYQWLDGSCFKNHGRLMCLAMGRDPEIELRSTQPLMYQGMSHDFLAPRQDIVLPREEDQIDFEAEVGIITGEVPMGTTAGEAPPFVRFVVLLNDISCRAHAKREMETGFGFIHAKPSTSFAPVAVTPDGLGPHWDGRVHLTIAVARNGDPFGAPSASEMSFNFYDLIEHAARTRTLCAGTVIGSGTISNVEYARVGSACIMERRAIEILTEGKPKTEFLRFGERVSVEAFDDTGSVFGRIDQRTAHPNRD